METEPSRPWCRSAAPSRSPSRRTGSGQRALRQRHSQSAPPEPAQPVFTRYWLHGKGPAPAGNLPVAVHVSPGRLARPARRGGRIRVTVACGPQPAAGTVLLEVPAALTLVSATWAAPAGGAGSGGPGRRAWQAAVPAGGWRLRRVGRLVRVPASAAAGQALRRGAADRRRGTGTRGRGRRRSRRARAASSRDLRSTSCCPRWNGSASPTRPKPS